ncbi:hypothetical protein D9619_010716 [Psilocybe cf. subviscida]|uniref:Uncharacterized protein n=1 Tax=Psilocybe cf. subviscida TaxID=2480587 RepID=A0A8H5B8K1_9AGAR|nr:hypothetical protein D9619_010716 [Psilocybe cf. subviscida]
MIPLTQRWSSAYQTHQTSFRLQIPASFSYYQSPTLRAASPSPIHLDALTLCCIAGQLMHSGFGVCVLPLSRTPAVALVQAVLGSTMTPTRPSSGHLANYPPIV